MLIEYVGHATVELTGGDGIRLITDPVLRSRVAHIRRIRPAPDVEPLRHPDAILISHAHHDHLDVRSLRSLAPRLVVCPPGTGRIVARAAPGEVVEMQPGDSLRVGEAAVRAVEVDHDGRRHPGHPSRTSLGYVVEAGATVFFAGDTDVFEGLGELGEIDVALLPVWGWGPKLGDGHMSPREAAEAAALIAPRVAIPIHWGTLAGPIAPWRDDPGRPAREFERIAAELAPATAVRVLEPGGSTEFHR